MGQAGSETSDSNAGVAVANAPLAPHSTPADVAKVRRALTTLAWPSLVENVLQTMLGVVNMIMVGRLGPADIAGIGLAAQVTMTFQVAYMGLSVGNTALVARSTGAKNLPEAERVAKQSSRRS